jgi:hypothetical protein
MRLVFLTIGLAHFCIFTSAVNLKIKHDVAVYQCPSSPSPTRFPRLEDVSIGELHVLFNNGSLTSVDLVHASLSFKTPSKTPSLTDKGLH